MIESTSQDSLQPLVTVLMPVRNEGPFISRSLGALLAQDYPAGRLEVIVADGMSTDGTRSLIASLQTQHPNLRLIDNQGQIVPTGLNAALAQARGEVIVRVDGHTIIAPDYVRSCVAVLQRSGADNAGGRMDAVSENRFGRAVARATSSPFGVGGARFHYSAREEWVETVYLGAWRRDVFGRIGLFDEEMVRNQDDEFNYRLLAAGGRIRLSPEIRSTYYNRSSVSALWRQYFQYGYWKVRVMQKHPGQMRLRHFIPPLFAAALALTSLAACFSGLGRWAWALVAGVYLVANLGASAYECAKRKGLGLLPLLPPAFAILHVGYGAGFLAGLIKFRALWGGHNNRPNHPVERVPGTPLA